MKLHEKIYYYRKKAGLSQDALAEKLGVSRQAISKWETAESVPETGKLAALASALGITVDWLLSEAEPEETRGPDTDAGCFTWDGETQSQPRSQAPDWVENLPRFLRSAARRWGWLIGVYIAISGLPFTIIGALATFISNSMLSDFGSSFGGMFGPTIEVNGVQVPIDGGSVGMVQSNPVAIFGTVIMIIGIVLIIAGIVLAVFLKRKSRE